MGALGRVVLPYLASFCPGGPGKAFGGSYEIVFLCRDLHVHLNENEKQSLAMSS